METDDTPTMFRALVECADKMFARVRDAPAYAARGAGAFVASERDYHELFKAYMAVWKFQQKNRVKLVEIGLQRWEIGEIASRIGQIYFSQYMRTSEARFLLESYVFHEAILHRGYFQGSVKVLSVRSKELRFYARFLLVSLLLNRREMVRLLVDKFKALVEDCKVTFRLLGWWHLLPSITLGDIFQQLPEAKNVTLGSDVVPTNTTTHKESNFKEWKKVVQEISRFMKIDSPPPNTRPLRYCAVFETHPDSSTYLARFHAKKVCKLRDVILTGYHRNEVKFAEVTLDTYRMLQCLEWDPSGSLYQKHQAEINENGRLHDSSGASELISMNLSAGFTDPTLPPNPRKAILYRPTVTYFLAVISTICEELPPETIMLIYLSCSGGCSTGLQVESSGGFKRPSNIEVARQAPYKQNPADDWEKGYLSSCYENSLSLGPQATEGLNNLFPGDLIPFTRRPLFLVIDSDSSDAFKVLHGAERGEPVALLLSPLRPSFKSPPDVKQGGSQFTFFLTAPVMAFCQLVGISFEDGETDVYEKAENILSNSFSKWEVILCTSRSLDLVWAQVLSDPFLRRLIIRFIFCRAVLYLFHPSEDRDQCMPVCLPQLPILVSPNAEAVKSSVVQLADLFRVSNCFSML